MFLWMLACLLASRLNVMYMDIFQQESNIILQYPFLTRKQSHILCGAQGTSYCLPKLEATKGQVVVLSSLEHQFIKTEKDCLPSPETALTTTPFLS